ncbi:class I SAM-dependent methyltransferase [Dactylosporangium sp. CA-139066]|uniref:class I SAM-dependent methyltransferase n=1 Tax=Dactylosporangium sp. CA-139066 TaxID=3239930 RepID=UPI003D940747
MQGPVDYDAELTRYGAVLRRAWDVRPGDRVLDIGCGGGRTTRDAARAAHAGRALGLDVSARAVERARALARAEGLGNVAFECADAQRYDFAYDSFDLAISRFGTMFFADPAAAFANIARALRPGGRLVMAVWQSGDRNEWDVTIRRALGDPQPRGPDPFSLADPAVVEEILRGAGFAGVTFTDVGEPVYYGPDPDAALDWVRGFSCTSAALQNLDPAAAAATLDRLRDALAEHLTADGVWFDARAWIVHANRGR